MNDTNVTNSTNVTNDTNVTNETSITYETWRKKMARLFNKCQGGSLEVLQANKSLLAELAEYCKKTPLYKDQYESTFKHAYKAKKWDAVTLYRLMVYKTANAPTTFHAEGVALLFVPLILEKLP